MFYIIYLAIISATFTLSIMQYINTVPLIKPINTYMVRGELVGLDGNNEPVINTAMRCLDITCVLTNDILSTPGVKSVKYSTWNASKDLIYIEDIGANFIWMFMFILICMSEGVVLIHSVYHLCKYFSQSTHEI